MSGSERDPGELEALELLPADVEAALADALAAAARPAALSNARHEAILAACLEDPLAPATDAERAAADALRAALEGAGDPAGAELAKLLAHAAGRADAPVDLEPALERALPAAPRARSNVLFVAFGASAGLAALAAGVLLWLGPMHRSAEPPGAAEDVAYATSRSLAPLFAGEGSSLRPSARIDRIEAVRARELRQNRYLSWGVR